MEKATDSRKTDIICTAIFIFCAAAIIFLAFRNHFSSRSPLLSERRDDSGQDWLQQQARDEYEAGTITYEEYLLYTGGQSDEE